MLIAIGCDAGPGDMTPGDAMLFSADEVLMEGGLLGALGRMAIGGAVTEVEDVGVETLDGEAADAGVEAALGESLLSVVVSDRVLLSPFPSPTGEVAAMTAANQMIRRLPVFAGGAGVDNCTPISGDWL
jgi:hypothetical protein